MTRFSRARKDVDPNVESVELERKPSADDHLATLAYG